MELDEFECVVLVVTFIVVSNGVTTLGKTFPLASMACKEAAPL